MGRRPAAGILILPRGVDGKLFSHQTTFLAPDVRTRLA
jgi:hypothetical protein